MGSLKTEQRVKCMKGIALAGMALVFLWGIVAGCAQKPADIGQKVPEVSEPAVQLTPEEQNTRAFEILEEILQLSDTFYRKENIPQIKVLYREIIETCPDTGVAQESFLRLILLAKEEKTDEGDAAAAQLYREFLERYPDSRLKRIIENELARD